MMRQSDRGKRTRSSTPRVRSGCQTCRTRHVKCDETHPSCLRCTQAGWTCDGYITDRSDPKSSINKKNTATTKTTVELAMSISSYALPFSVPGSQRDRQIIHYFCVQGSYEIAGCFNGNFWTNTVLQQSHRDSVVRQALVSLGTLHLDYTTTSGSEKDVAESETLNLYGRALRALRRRLEKGDPEARRTALICCILFYCVEAALGNSVAAMSHLRNGLNLLPPNTNHHGCGKADDFGSLRRVFEELDLQATIFDDAREPYFDLTTGVEQESSFDNIIGTGVFLHLEEAYQALLVLQNSLFNFLTKNMPYKSYEREALPASTIEQKCTLVERFGCWSTQFDYLMTRKNQDERTTCGVQILLMQWQSSAMLLEADYPPDQSVFGAIPNLRAEEVLNLADDILRRTEKISVYVSMGGQSRRNLSSANGIVAPLFMLAMKCSDEHICDRATRLLASSKRREGLYDAQSMVAIIQQFVAARQEKRIKIQEQDIEENMDSSLERAFQTELSGLSVSMDRIAECLELDPQHCYD